jgi:carbon-monoxide dehydrogenase medium subunit
VPSLLPPFTIDQPASLAEASTALIAYGDAGRPYAGGTELLLVMKHGGLRYEHLVDLKTIAGLDRIEEQNGSVWIGALATHRAIERSALVRQHLPAFAETARKVANPRVRATGTLGGNLCFAEPHSDPATLLLVLDARYHLVGPDGTRRLLADQLVVGPYETALADGELLMAVEIPLPGPGWRFAYRKFQVRERPMVGLALALALDLGPGAETVREARVAVGSLTPTPRRAPEAEALLAGPVSEVTDRLGSAAAALADASELLDDLEGSAEYKHHLIRVLLCQAFEQLSSQAPSGGGA